MPPKSAAASATNVRSTKRKAKDDLTDNKIDVRKRRQLGPIVSNHAFRETSQHAYCSEITNQDTAVEDDAADFVFTRTRKAPMNKDSIAPTRVSPRNHAKATTTSDTGATPRVAKPRNNHEHIGLPNKSDCIVPLPIQDTPVARRNQKMRENGGDGRRRSSLSMRGQRASSIGQKGIQSLPHPDVPSSDFYKHISAELPEPVRMKQLLAWCARRSIDESRTRQSAYDTGSAEQTQAANIARTIEEEVLKDLVENRITTSWYNQPVKENIKQATRPHPQNIKNAATIKDIEERIKKLCAEEDAWDELRTKYQSLHGGPSTSNETDSTQASSKSGVPEERFPKTIEENVDLDLLPAQEAEFLHSISTRAATRLSTTTTNDDWLQEAESNLEYNVDSLLHSQHQQNQFLKQVDEQVGRILEASDRTIRAADEKAHEATRSQGIGTRDMLRHFAP